MNGESLKAATAEQAWEVLARLVAPGPTLDVHADHAFGAVLAADVVAACDYPPFDRACVDGFAVRSRDLRPGRLTLRSSGLTRAGDVAAEELAEGVCRKINTGAPLPPGADACVMIEDTQAGEGAQVIFTRPPKPGENCERQAGLLRKGDLLLKRGTRIDGGAAAALFSAGVEQVRISKRPRVAVLSTGDEIVAAGRPLRPGQIVDSNSVALGQAIRETGADFIGVGRCGDEREALRNALKNGLENDLLCVVGGMSKGTHDYVPGLLEQLGVHWVVEGLNLKPGRPTRIGRAPRGGWVLGLPGNPVSCAVCFLLFGRFILEGLMGLPPKPPPRLSGKLDERMPANGARPMFQPAEWRAGADGEVRVRPIPWRGSGDPFGLAAANALIYRPAEVRAADTGHSVAFVPLACPR